MRIRANVPEIKPPENLGRKISLRMTEKQFQKIEHICKLKKIRPSDLIRYMVDNFTHLLYPETDGTKTSN
jgi:hypothetical protein